MNQPAADWHRRVVGRSLRSAQLRSIDRGAALVRAAAAVLERTNGEGITVQDVADEAGQSLRTLYQYFESKDDLLLAVFEEAMLAYAQLIRAAIADLDDPLERLAGALLAASELPARSDTRVAVGLTRLRLKLTEVEPELIGRAQAPVTSVLGELLDAAVAVGRLPELDRDATTFLLLAINTAAITATMLGNDVGPRAPDPHASIAFCLRGMGAEIGPDHLAAISAQLHMPKSTSTRPTPQEVP